MKNQKLKIKNLLLGVFLCVLVFGGGFSAGMRFAEKKIAQKSTFDKGGFVKSVTKTITGRILEIKKDSLVLVKNNQNFAVRVDPNAKITITQQRPTRPSLPGQVATPDAFLVPPEMTQPASLADLRLGDQVTLTVTEAFSGTLVARVVSARR